MRLPLRSSSTKIRAAACALPFLANNNTAPPVENDRSVFAAQRMIGFRF
jgi:hypothetical protein